MLPVRRVGQIAFLSNHQMIQTISLRLILKAEGLLTFLDLIDPRPLLQKAMVKGTYLETDELLPVLRIAESGQEWNNSFSLKG